jgi:uncharacterized protein YhaN
MTIIKNLEAELADKGARLDAAEVRVRELETLNDTLLAEANTDLKGVAQRVNASLAKREAVQRDRIATLEAALRGLLDEHDSLTGHPSDLPCPVAGIARGVLGEGGGA